MCEVCQSTWFDLQISLAHPTLRTFPGCTCVRARVRARVRACHMFNTPPPPRGRGAPTITPKKPPISKRQQQLDARNAAYRGHVDVVENFIAAGGNVNLTMPSDGCTLLYCAAWAGHEPVVTLLLEKDADVDQAKPDTGATPLFVAARNGHLAIVDKLIVASADVNQATTDHNCTPLYIAARYDHASIVSTLILHGADKTIAGLWGTPLEVARVYGSDSVIGLLK